jgi:hypothetical protein
MHRQESRRGHFNGSGLIWNDRNSPTLRHGAELLTKHLDEESALTAPDSRGSISEPELLVQPRFRLPINGRCFGLSP